MRLLYYVGSTLVPRLDYGHRAGLLGVPPRLLVGPAFCQEGPPLHWVLPSADIPRPLVNPVERRVLSHALIVLLSENRATPRAWL